MSEGTPAKNNPGDFLKTVIGRPVVVKLNSGVDYRGKRSAAMLAAAKTRASFSQLRAPISHTTRCTHLPQAFWPAWTAT